MSGWGNHVILLEVSHEIDFTRHHSSELSVGHWGTGDHNATEQCAKGLSMEFLQSIGEAIDTMIIIL